MFIFGAIKVIKSNTVRLYKAKRQGTVVSKNGVLKVISNGVLLDITPDSYSCYGKKVVYTTDKHPLPDARIIRDETSRVECNTEFYVPFKVGNVAIGRECMYQGRICFHIISAHNPKSEDDVIETAKAYKLFEDLENKK